MFHYYENNILPCVEVLRKENKFIFCHTDTNLEAKRITASPSLHSSDKILNDIPICPWDGGEMLFEITHEGDRQSDERERERDDTECVRDVGEEKMKKYRRPKHCAGDFSVDSRPPDVCAMSDGNQTGYGTEPFLDAKRNQENSQCLVSRNQTEQG